MSFPRVLMIDDSRVDAVLMQRALRKLEIPNAFRWISDAEEGLEVLSREEECVDDIVFLDIKMPKITGLELLAALHERGVLNRIRKINVLSSSALDRDLEVALQYDNVAFYTKPAGYTSLCA